MTTNRYANLGTAEIIEDSFNKINDGFLGVQNDLDNRPAFMSRQALINGNFDVWQRGTSFSNPSSNLFVADRWQEANTPDGGTLPTISISQQRLASGDIPNSFYYASLGTNGAGTSLGTNSVYRLTQNIENGTRFLCGASKKVTVSFYARSNIANKRVGIWLFQGYGTGGSPSAGESLNGTTFTLTPSFQRFSFTFTTNTLAGKTFGTNNDDALSLNFYYMWGASRASIVGASTAETFGGSGVIDIAQVQVNAGDTALPFQPRSFAEELALCQRYNRRTTGDGTVQFASLGTGYCNSSTQAYIFIPLPTRMRIVPTLAYSGTFRINSGASAIPVTSMAIAAAFNSSDYVVFQVTTAGGLTAGYAATLSASGDAAAYINLDAEL